LDNKLIDLSKENNVNFISAIKILCHLATSECFVAQKLDDRMYLTTWDTGHLTETGSIYFLENLIKNLNY
jgi:hypothetical protein